MEHNDLEYNPETDKLSSNITAIIIGVSILAAIYLGFFVVV
jgi:hypothetical protein